MASVGTTGYYRISWIVLVFFLPNCFVIAEKLTIWTDPHDNYDTTHTTYNVTTSGYTWWAAAQSGCSQFGGHLYIPRSQSFPDVLLTQMQSGVDYWIGAVKYPTWVWTADQSTLYTHVGYMRISTYWPMFHLEGNCVLTCHQHCKEHYKTIGLRGKECYCLENHWPAEQSDHSQVRCPGNYGEFCGDDNGVSLYKLEDFITIPSPSDRCGFVSESTRESRTISSYRCYYPYTSYYLTVYLENNCDVRKRKACEGDYWYWTCSRNICVSGQNDTFENSKRNCNLVQVTRSNIDDLCHAIARNKFWSWPTYWIGLQRKSEQKWMNGSDMVLDASDYYDDVLPLCLAVSKTYEGVQFHWTKCLERSMSICEILKVRTTKPPTRMSTKTTNTSPGMSTHTTNTSPGMSTHTTNNRPSWMSTHTTNRPSPPSSGPSSSTDTVLPSSTNATSKHHTEPVPASVQQPSSNTGIYVGCSIAAVAVVVSLVFLLISYRQRFLCFKDKGSVPSRGHVHFIAGVDNATYSGAVAPPEDQGGINMSVSPNSSPHYSVIPVATVTPNNHVNLKSSRRDTENQKDYYNIKPGNNTLSVTGSSSQELTDDGHYVVPKGSLSKITQKHPKSTEPTAHYHTTDQPHYAVPHSRGVDDVDGTRGDVGDGIYHLAGEIGKKDDVYSLPSVIHVPSRDTKDVGAPYITLIQDTAPLNTRPGTGEYDRVIHPSQRHDYDTVSRDRRMMVGADTYDHLGHADHDVDDSYDTTRHQQQRRRLDDYSHTDVLNVVLEDDDDDVDDTYHYINETEEDEVEATHGNVQPVYINTGNSYAQAADDADYYNLPFVTDAGGDISDDPGNQQDDKVYSQARTVSDA
ncbi:uncharacterized protein LOC124285970 isoform X2 [Haliotis rubra]|uniref:uncharacterized protein LOC124285970 isoform X2 n=1 Tax=Haliotis rubra TaxID=36100 RepID=UPI001EE5D16F|nr:uncharacterized protein LOC124285970 isoform X2 [Haliotis rubra]